jgi:hypothetical protein
MKRAWALCAPFRCSGERERELVETEILIDITTIPSLSILLGVVAVDDVGLKACNTINGSATIFLSCIQFDDLFP